MAVTREIIHYFAYGSNLHPVRLGERVSSARLVDTVKLNEHRVTFHKKSHDGSSKCNLVKTGIDSDTTFGALYEIELQHKDLLDGFEGRGNGYQDGTININMQGKEYKCFTYFAEESHIEENLLPYHWYKKLVVLGARYLKFPQTYVARLESVNSLQDSNFDRRQRMQSLIEKITIHEYPLEDLK